MIDSKPPSQIRNDYWVYAENPAPPNQWADRCGKWILFIPWKKLDHVWQVIAAETRSGALGISAKAATAKKNGLAKNLWVKVIANASGLRGTASSLR